MGADFTEIHDELRAVARDLLAAVPADAAVDWALLAGSGWLGLEVPETLDGAGATFAEVAVILVEMGRAATRSPYLGSVVLGVGALALLEPEPNRDELLRGVASGALVLAVALVGGEDDTLSGEPPFRIVRSEGRLRVHGRAAFVTDAVEADRLLLLALDAEHGPVIVEVDPHALGLGRSEQPVLDATRRFGLVTADGVEVSEADVWQFSADPHTSVRRLLDRAAVAIACDSLGLSEAMLDATVAYATVRQQFGRPIGSFQAVKHACADMLVQITVARELVSAAVAQLVADDPAATVGASMAKSYACGAAVHIAGQAMQLHGGIGYTWESGIHVFLKRATLDRALFASPAAHRRRLAARYV